MRQESKQPDIQHLNDIYPSAITPSQPKHYSHGGPRCNRHPKQPMVYGDDSVAVEELYQSIPHWDELSEKKAPRSLEESQ
jgi:hypothetical protein